MITFYNLDITRKSQYPFDNKGAAEYIYIENGYICFYILVFAILIYTLSISAYQEGSHIKENNNVFMKCLTHTLIRELKEF